MRARRREGGFTLIEILVAFMILGMTLTVLLRIFSGGLHNVAIAGDYAHAVLVAEAQLAAAGVDAPLQAGESGGEWDERFIWRQVVEEYSPPEGVAAVDNPPVAAYRVSVTVEWERNGRTRQLSLQSVRLKETAPAKGRG